MWKRLKLTNFRRHKALEIALGSGIQVIRGDNEIGKTTIGEGAGYALFGAKALRNSLEDTVTWGEKPNTLRAELDWEADGKVYLFTRHKGGAEILLDGKVLVTGQTEVTNFAAQLVGADPAMANNLMFASQNNLRGALEQGPKATAEVIEDLADFNLFDLLIERMQERLVLGSDKVLKDRLQQANDRLAVFANPEAPDTSGIEIKIQETKALQAQFEGNRVKFDANLDAAKAALVEAQTLAKTWAATQASVDQLTKRTAQEESEIQNLTTLAGKDLPDEKILALEAQVSEASEYEERQKDYQAFVRQMATYPEVFWEGDKVSLRQAIADASQLTKELQDKRGELAQTLAKAKHDLVHDRNCPTCGQDVTKVWDIDKRVAEAQALADACTLEDAKLASDLGVAQADHDDLQAVLVAGEPFERLTYRLANWVSADSSVFPPKLSWLGEAPVGDSLDVASLSRQLKELKGERDAILRSRVQLEMCHEALAKTQAQLEEAKAYLATLTAPTNLLPLEQAITRALTTKNENERALSACAAQISQWQGEVEAAKRGYEQAMEASAKLKLEVQAIEAELKQLEANNTLLKKVRAARPVVSDKLWAIVLTAVSKMFSQMRGEQSVVTKGTKGFMVNGQNITSLSGSALDLLGLSIRCALIKTFVPEASTLLLDEPAAACSEERTASLLAFIRGAGFPQVTLITHEDLSEQVCDGLITL